ncbi:MAG TPA: tripartite tricarboxylate transporter TctB family protein [Chondromyces sp.]|nr:tripartite tricarboxylate transporter TctB family protein [Chondromyces sp.]
MKSITANIIGCVFFLIVGIWFLVNALFLPGSQNSVDVGPAAFPILSAVGIILASVFYMIREIGKRKAESGEKIIINDRNKVLISMGLLVLYALVMQLAGYYIASAIFVPVFLFVTGVRSLLKVVPVSIGFILFVYVAFDVLLEIPLP